MDDAADRGDVTASLGGDAEAYRRIVRRHQGAVIRRMRRFARGGAADAEELTHEVFVEAYFSRFYNADVHGDLVKVTADDPLFRFSGEMNGITLAEDVEFLDQWHGHADQRVHVGRRP